MWAWDLLSKWGDEGVVLVALGYYDEAERGLLCVSQSPAVWPMVRALCSVVGSVGDSNVVRSLGCRARIQQTRYLVETMAHLEGLGL